MATRSIPDSPKYYYTYYNDLKGVDFSRDRTEVSRKRSPDMVNMISDNGGNPVKRLGWRTVQDIGCGKIHDILVNTENNVVNKYIVGDNGIYVTDGETVTQLVEYNSLENCDIFLYGGSVYAFVNSKIYKFENGEADDLLESGNVYIPESSISRNPDGTGGVSYEGINLLTPKRVYSFLGNDEDTTYQLAPDSLLESDFYKYIVKGSVKVEIMNDDGDFKEATLGTDYTLGDSVSLYGKNVHGETEQFTLCSPVITFTSVHAPIVAGQDNVRITFENFDYTEDHTETINGQSTTVYVGQFKESRGDLLKTHITRAFGYATTDRVFAVGGENQNRIYYTGIDDPTFWPDNNYIIAGQDGNPIIGLHTYSSYLAIVKGDQDVETTVYLAYGALSSTDGENVYFAIKPTLGGEGAVAPNSFATLGDDPLFLTRNGVFALSNIFATTDNVLRNRSYYIDKVLIVEPNLENAVAIVWKRYYILCVNGHCYVLDGRNKSSDSNNTTNYSYECYYWENVPATAFHVYQNELWFGTDDGRLCKFNTDVDNRTAYCDDGILQADGTITSGTAIFSRWSTILDDDGRPQYFKTLNKKGSLLTMLPYDRTSAHIKLVADGDRVIDLGYFYADIFNWELIDFERFTFNSNDTAQDAFFRKKLKKYKRLQIVIENDEAYEPFGILKITKTYTINNFSKNRG